MLSLRTGADSVNLDLDLNLGLESEKKRGRRGEIYATMGCAAVCGGKGLEQKFHLAFLEHTARTWGETEEGRERREEGGGKYFSACVWSRVLDRRLAW